MILGLLLKPSQGTFNFAIFINHKIYNLRKFNAEHLSIAEALCITIMSPSEVPEIVLDLDNMLIVDSIGRQQQEAQIQRLDESLIDPIQRPIWFMNSTPAHSAGQNSIVFSRELVSYGRSSVDDLGSKMNFSASFFSKGSSYPSNALREKSEKKKTSSKTSEDFEYDDL